MAKHLPISLSLVSKLVPKNQKWSFTYFTYYIMYIICYNNTHFYFLYYIYSKICCFSQRIAKNQFFLKFVSMEFRKCFQKSIKQKNIQFPKNIVKHFK